MRRADNKDYNMLKSILQSQGPAAAMQRIGQFRNQISPRDLRAAEMAVKQFAKGGMVGAEASYKANGGWVGNYAYGGATPKSHPGKPMGTDTVPAWLTEGEFVVDKDSAQKFRPMLEKINDWEPTTGKAGMEARHSDRVNQQAQYKQLGGIISNLAGGNQFDAQRQAAQRAAQAQKRGSLLAGGTAGSGLAAQNQAGLITQAGQGNQAFTPQAGALASVGKGLQGAQEAEAGYQQELGRIAEAERAAKEAERIRQEDLAREDKLRAEDKEAADKEAEAKLKTAKQESLRMLMDAKFLASKAGKAGDIVNRHVSIDDDETQGLLDKLQGGIATAISAGTEVFGATSERDKLLIAYANQKFPDSYDAYVRLATLAKNLVKPLIASGILGRTSDGDIKFAEQTIFDPTQPSNTWISQLNDAIARVKGISISRGDAVEVNATAQENVFGTAATSGGPGGGHDLSSTTYAQSGSADSVLDKGWKIITGG